MTDLQIVREALEEIKANAGNPEAVYRLTKAALSRLEAAADHIVDANKKVGTDVPVGEVKPGVWPDSVSDAVLQTPEPDRWFQDEPRPVPMFYMATLMRYGERCAEAGMSAITRAVKPAPAASEVKPVAFVQKADTAAGFPEGGHTRVIWLTDHESLPAGHLFTTPPTPTVPEGWKDHDTAQLVNDLRDIAVQYRDTQQLRERIAQVIRPLAEKAGTVPEGWRMVPVELTDAMRDACTRVLERDDVDFAWAAMLAAAPQPGDKA